MDPRTAAAQPQAMAVKRRVAILSVETKTLQEVDVPADSAIWGLTDSAKSGQFGLVLGVPEGAATIKRKLWMCTVNTDVSVEAQNGEFVGRTYLSSSETNTPPVLVLVFIEVQKAAIERARHFGGRSPAL